jgi:uncharacterized protein (TIGR02186 family)
MICRIALIAALLAMPAAAEEIVAGLSQNRVSITANFDGSEILIYGAVKRDTPPADAAPLEVIVTVEGPSTPLIIRKKARRGGIWVNAESVQVDRAPSFYAVASTGPISSILSRTEDLRHRITIPRAIRAVGISAEAAEAPDFIAALLRIRHEADRYRLSQGGVEFLEETLFRADVLLPSNLTDGEYRVRIFLTRQGRVVDAQERVIGVRKEGVERFLYTLAKDRPLITGLLSVALAALAGWAASAAFRLIRP